jgi:hypothetical protein
MSSLKSTPKVHGMFQGIQEAQASKSTRQLDVGSYVLKVDALRTFKSRKDGMQVFAADLEVVESDHRDFQPGDKVGFIVKQGKFLQYFLADVKAFLSAVGKVTDDQITEEVADMAVSDAQPFRGETLRCIVTPNSKDERYRVSRFLPLHNA